MKTSHSRIIICVVWEMVMSLLLTNCSKFNQLHVELSLMTASPWYGFWGDSSDTLIMLSVPDESIDPSPIINDGCMARVIEACDCLPLPRIYYERLAQEYKQFIEDASASPLPIFEVFVNPNKATVLPKRCTREEFQVCSTNISLRSVKCLNNWSAAELIDEILNTSALLDEKDHVVSGFANHIEFGTDNYDPLSPFCAASITFALNSKELKPLSDIIGQLSSVQKKGIWDFIARGDACRVAYLKANTTLLANEAKYINKPCIVTDQNEFARVLRLATAQEYPQSIPLMGPLKDIGIDAKPTWAYEHMCYKSQVERESDGSFATVYRLNTVCDPYKTGCDVKCINTKPGCEEMKSNATGTQCYNICKMTDKLDPAFCPDQCKKMVHQYYPTDDGLNPHPFCNPSKDGCNIKCNNLIPGCEGYKSSATGSQCPLKCRVTVNSVVGGSCPSGEPPNDCTDEVNPIEMGASSTGCPMEDGRTCEITKEIDIGFKWEPTETINLKCRYKTPTWPFKLDIEAGQGLSVDQRIITPTFSDPNPSDNNPVYLFNIEGPEVSYPSNKPEEIRIAGFDFSQLGDIKLCRQGPNCIVDIVDTHLGESDSWCDEVGATTTLEGKLEQQQSALSVPR